MEQQTHQAKHVWLWLGIVAVAALGVAAVATHRIEQLASLQQTLVAQVGSVFELPEVRPVNPDDQTITLHFLGDIMLDRGVERRIDVYGEGDYRYPFMLAAERIGAADLTFANLEGPVSDHGRDVGGKYSFRFPPESLDGLTHAGIDVVSLANNHIYDWGPAALIDSLEELEAVGIASVGAGADYREANRAYIHDIDGTRIAFLAYTDLYPSGLIARDDRAGVSDYDMELVQDRIEALVATDQADIIVVSMHWGDEYQTRSNAKQQREAHGMIDAGADLIIGHHPHVVQEVERYGDGYVFYSLGNAVFDQKFSDETMAGIMAEVTLVDGELAAARGIPFELTPRYQMLFGG